MARRYALLSYVNHCLDKQAKLFIGNVGGICDLVETANRSLSSSNGRFNCTNGRFLYFGARVFNSQINTRGFPARIAQYLKLETSPKSISHSPEVLGSVLAKSGRALRPPGRRLY